MSRPFLQPDPNLLISVSGLSRSFRGTVALDNVSLQLDSGQVLGLAGENGAGKTTLIRHLLGLLRASSGTVRVLNHDPAESPEHVFAQTGYLSEDRDLPDWMTISQLLHYRAAFHSNWDHDLQRELCDAFELPLQTRIRHLSRGQLARTGLVLAVSFRPALLILDEPSSGLDPLVRSDILATILRTTADEGRSVLFSTHLLEEIDQVCDSIVMLHHGRVVLHSTPAEIEHNYTHLTLPSASAVALTALTPATICRTTENGCTTFICELACDQIESEVRSRGLTDFQAQPVAPSELCLALLQQTRDANNPRAGQVFP